MIKPALPAEAAEIGQTGPQHHRQHQQAGPDEAMEGKIGRASPTAMPCLAATKPAAQQAAAAIPHSAPMAVADSSGAKRWSGKPVSVSFAGRGYTAGIRSGHGSAATRSHVRREDPTDAGSGPRSQRYGLTDPGPLSNVSPVAGGLAAL